MLVGEQILPPYVCAFIDCHSRYVIEARYYLRQNLNILIDYLLRAMTTHGAPGDLYLDKAKVYLAKALKVACYGFLHATSSQDGQQNLLRCPAL